MSATEDIDVQVVGAGPAGWALAAACVERGLRVGLLADRPDAPWHQTYGAWLDELGTAGVEQFTRQRWPRALVRTTGTNYRELGRTYCLVDNDRLRSHLVQRAAGTEIRHGRAVAVSETSGRAVVTTDDGERLAARVVIDATGFPSAFGAGTPPGAAWQTAYGVIGTFARPPAPSGAMCLMDFDVSPFADERPTTFLYAMDLGGGRWFVEETSLAARPKVALPFLAERLQRRLHARGTPVTTVESIERCAFVMDAPLPTRGPAVAFGAAAALVHPATGYHLAYALTRAGDVADALVSALGSPDGSATAIARTISDAVWTSDRRRRHALYRFGLEVLLGLDPPATRAFFDAFFRLPPEHWRRYVSRTASSLQVQATMARLMGTVPLPLQARLLRHAASPAGRHWLRQAVLPTR